MHKKRKYDFATLPNLSSGKSKKYFLKNKTSNILQKFFNEVTRNKQFSLFEKGRRVKFCETDFSCEKRQNKLNTISETKPNTVHLK